MIRANTHHRIINDFVFSHQIRQKWGVLLTQGDTFLAYGRHKWLMQTRALRQIPH